MPEDREQSLELARMQVEETLPHLDFRPDIAARTFDAAVATGNPTIFVADEDGELIGYLVGLIEGYAFTSGVYCAQEVLYVRPDKRGTRAAACLTKEFIKWGDVVGARELSFGISNKFQPERTARFFEHFGAERVGIYLRKVRS